MSRLIRSDSGAVTKGGRAGRCILLVSEDSTLCDTLNELVGPDGHEVVHSSPSMCSMESCGAPGPDLIMIDSVLSETDWSRAKELAQKLDPTVPLVAVTDTVLTATAAENLIKRGVYDVIGAPLRGTSVRFAVRRALERRDLAAFRQAHEELLDQAIKARTLELVRDKDFLKGILNSSTLVSVVLTDLDQNVLFWNTGAENIFGYTAEEMVGNKVTRLYPPDALTRETVRKLRNLVRRKHGTVQGNMNQVAKDGRTLTVSLALSPMLNQSGELQGILGVGLDVTEEVNQQKEILRLLLQVKKTREVSIFTLAKLSESRDEETGLHLMRIQEYCRLLCEGLARRETFRQVITPEFTEDLYQSSVLHDIGKVAIPDEVLKSSGVFSPEEREIMKRHPLVGGKALEEAVNKLGEKSFLSTGVEVAYYHHERWDGNGYPFGLKGEEIPIAARIVAVADVYDALTSKRRYKRAFAHREACQLILEQKAKQFDPVLVEVFKELENDFLSIREAYDSVCDPGALDSTPNSI